MKIGGIIAIVMGIILVTTPIIIPDSGYAYDAFTIAGGILAIALGVALVLLKKKVTAGGAMKIWGTILSVFGTIGIASPNEYSVKIVVALIFIAGVALLGSCYIKSTKTPSQQ